MKTCHLEFSADVVLFMIDHYSSNLSLQEDITTKHILDQTATSSLMHAFVQDCNSLLLQGHKK